MVVEVEPVRQYLNERGEVDGRLLSHVLGYVGPVNLQEFRELEDDGYLRDDLIGRAGIEATFEAALRGTYGTELKERDAQGRPLKTIRTLQEPESGKNLMLTLDTDAADRHQSLQWGMRAVGLEQGVTVVR